MFMSKHDVDNEYTKKLLGMPTIQPDINDFSTRVGVIAADRRMGKVRSLKYLDF